MRWRFADFIYPFTKLPIYQFPPVATLLYLPPSNEAMAVQRA
jgi:hypothetical protein